MNPLTKVLGTVGRDTAGRPREWSADHLHRWCCYIGVLDAEQCWRLPHTAQHPPNAQDLFSATKDQLTQAYVSDPQVANRIWECVDEMKGNGLQPFHQLLRRTARKRHWVGTKTARWLQARKHEWAKGPAAKRLRENECPVAGTATMPLCSIGGKHRW